MNRKILVIDDEKNIRFIFKDFLSKEGHDVLTAGSYSAAIEIISKTEPDLMFVDIILGGKTGIDILNEVKKRKLQCPVIIITGKPSLETSAAAVRGGAFDYIVKPFLKEDMLKVTFNALRHKSLLEAKNQAEAEKENYRRNLDAIFWSLQDGIITVDNNLEVLEANNAVKNICGLTKEKIYGKYFPKVKTYCRHDCRKVLQETQKTKLSVTEYRIECRHKERPRQVVLLTSSPLIDPEKGLIGGIMVIRDISRITYLEKELREKHKYFNLIGKSKQIQNVYRLLEDLSDTDTTVLITGESGTGKEVVARTLHYGGVRASRPLITINCSALAESLLESELFGHVKGAFTGAVKDKTGRFQAADTGTIFLDEIGDISPFIQLKLLRFLQEHQFEKVGDSETIKVDVRIITATNQDLKKKVGKGEFREDLYYRLNVIEIPLPPLRVRKEDVPLLVDYFCAQFNVKQKKNIEGVSDEVMEAFMRYSWPGNIRELEHAIEHAFVLCRDRVVMTDQIPLEVMGTSPEPKITEEKNQGLDADEIIRTLETTDWNKSKAARILGVSRPTLYKKIEEFNISKPSG